jgi:hypothetical protein
VKAVCRAIKLTPALLREKMGGKKEKKAMKSEKKEKKKKPTKSEKKALKDLARDDDVIE